MKSLGSTTVDWRPLRANSLIMSVHWVKMNSWLASAARHAGALDDRERLRDAVGDGLALGRDAATGLLHGLGTGAASVTTLMRSASASDWAASFSRCAELMRFMDCSTSAGKSMEVMSVLTTS